MEDSAAAVGWDVEEGGVRKCYQGNREVDFGGVYGPSADRSDGLGDVASNILSVRK